MHQINFICHHIKKQLHRHCKTKKSTTVPQAWRVLPRSSLHVSLPHITNTSGQLHEAIGRLEACRVVPPLLSTYTPYFSRHTNWFPPYPPPQIRPPKTSTAIITLINRHGSIHQEFKTIKLQARQDRHDIYDLPHCSNTWNRSPENNNHTTPPDFPIWCT